MSRTTTPFRKSLIIGWTTLLTASAIVLEVFQGAPFPHPADALPNSPSIASVAPAYGSPLGGDLVTITGAGFTSATTVRFDGVPALLTFVSDSTLRVETPGHAPGAVDVTVENENGNAVFVEGFVYDAGLSLVTIDPDRGSPLGGDSLHLIGTGFTLSMQVEIGGRLLEGIHYVDSHNAFVTTPSHAPGAVDVTLTNELGTATLLGGFTFTAPPALLALDPAQGPLAGNIAITLTGTGFTPSDVVFFGTELALGVVPIDAQTMEVILPPHPEGRVDVIVFGPNGSAVLPQGFEYISTPAGEAVPFERGDANGDSDLDIADGIFLIHYFFVPPSPAPSCLDAADANDDSGLNISDVIFTISYLFQDGPTPPTPFPSCGLDDTTDALDCETYPGC